MGLAPGCELCSRLFHMFHSSGSTLHLGRVLLMRVDLQERSPSCTPLLMCLPLTSHWQISRPSPIHSAMWAADRWQGDVYRIKPLPPVPLRPAAVKPPSGEQGGPPPSASLSALTPPLPFCQPWFLTPSGPRIKEQEKVAGEFSLVQASRSLSQETCQGDFHEHPQGSPRV